MDYIEKNPVKGIQQPKYVKEIRFLTEIEINKLIKVVDDQDYKDLILAYIHTGARRKEILAPQLKWEHIDLITKKLRLHTKCNKIRIVPMNDTLYEILKRRLESGVKYPFELNYHYCYKRIIKSLVSG